MTRIATVILFALAVAAQAGCAHAGATTDAKAWVEALYQRYANGEEMSDALWQKEIYDTAMLALMKEDERLTPQGEVGVLDWDPICQCQDFSKIRATVSVRVTSPTTAVAIVDFKDIGWENQEVRHATFDLLKEAQGWRIHDIHSKDFDNPTHSMRERFIEANKERRQ